MGCNFCASTSGGLVCRPYVRQEMVDQVLFTALDSKA